MFTRFANRSVSSSLSISSRRAPSQSMSRGPESVHEKVGTRLLPRVPLATPKQFCWQWNLRTNRSLFGYSQIHRTKLDSGRRFESSVSGRKQKPAWRQELREFLEEALKKPRTVPIPRWITPKHVSFTMAELFGHSSFVLVAISYAVDDFLMLRMLAVAGSSVMLVFTYFHPHGRVLWLPFSWNCLFIALNSFRIGKSFWNAYMAEKLSPELLDLRQNFFYLMDTVDYARLVRTGSMEEFKQGEVLAKQGVPNQYIRLVVSGNLRVLREGKLTYMLDTANFVSEAGLHAGLLLSGEIDSCCTIVADSDTATVLTWNRTELMDLMEKYPGIRSWIRTVLSWDIVRKLKSQREMLASGAIEDPEEWTGRRNRQTHHRYYAILKNILAHHPQYLQDRRKELDKYRMVHNIDDKKHADILKECGWTLEEFENGERKGTTGYRHKNVSRDLRWHLNTAFLRVFG